MEVLKKLFQSKKFVASLAGGLAVILAVMAPKMGFPMEEVQAEQLAQYLATLVAAYVVAQGAADHGKEVELIRANGNGTGNGRALPEDPEVEEPEG